MMASLNVPVGFRFNPTDQELVGYYLQNKVTPAAAAAATPLPHYSVPEFGNFGETKPWEMWEMWEKVGVPKLLSGELYFFTKLKMASRGRVDRKVGLGTWSEGEAAKLIYEHHDDDDDEEEEILDHEKVAIGRKRKLRYEEKGSEHNGGWFIDEYSLVDAAGRSCYNQLVICRLRKNDRSSSTRSNKRKSSSSSSSSCATKKIKSRVNDVDDHSHELGQDSTSALATTTIHHPQLSAPDLVDDDDPRFMVDISDLISLDDLDPFDYSSVLMSSDPVVDIDQALQSLPTYDNNETVVFQEQSLTSTTTCSNYGAAGTAQGQVVAGGYSNQQEALDDMIFNSSNHNCWSNYSFVNQLLMP